MISVIVPIYNSKDNLKKCLESISDQTYHDFEVLMINDGSTDGSDQICSEYAKKDRRFKLFNQSNAGASAARNLGLRQSCGEYITFIDSDDTVPDYFFEDALNNLISYDADIVMGGYRRTNSDHDSIPNIPAATIYASSDIMRLKRFFIAFSAENGVNFELKGCENLLSPWGKIFKKEVILNVQFPEQLTLDEDTIFNLNALDNANKVIVVPTVYYFYNISGKGISSRNFRPNVAEELRLSWSYFNDYVNKHSEEDFSEELQIRTVKSYIRGLNYYFCNSHNNLRKKIKELHNFMSTDPYESVLKDAPINKYILSKRTKIYCFLGKHKMAVATLLFYHILRFKKLSIPK